VPIDGRPDGLAGEAGGERELEAASPARVESGAVRGDHASAPAEARRPPTEWTVVCASAVGRAHVAQGKGNEDAFATAQLPDGRVVLALADGAGSAPRGGEGARLAVATAAAALASTAGDGYGQERTLEVVLADVRRKVAATARQRRTRPRVFASTLLLAVLGPGELVVLQLGDGGVVGLGDNGWKRLVEPQRGRHAGETVFVTSRRAGALARVETHSASAFRAVALFSDGLEPVATDLRSGAPFAPFFDPLAAFARAERPRAGQEAALEAFLAGDRVQSRSADDLSLILAVRP
jgi:hypothetical protein